MSVVLFLIAMVNAACAAWGIAQIDEAGSVAAAPLTFTLVCVNIVAAIYCLIVAAREA